MNRAGQLPARRLVSQADAAMVERADVPRSRFVSSWTRKQTLNAGLVVPFMWDEALPGDYLRYDTMTYLRMATPVYPLFSNVKADVFFFYVPNRLVWPNWERFMGEQPNPTDTIELEHPYTNFTQGGSGDVVGSLADYMGLPIQRLTAGQSIRVNSLPFRAYAMIWNDWFRDQNLQTAAAFGTGDGLDTTTSFTVRPRNKFHDYFTSALPWTQKFTAPTVPVGGLARVIGIGDNGATAATTGPLTPVRETAASGTTPNPWPEATYNNYKAASTAGVTINYAFNGATWAPQVFADLTSATGVSINTLRQAVQIQRLLERDARGGTRYNELILAHFGVRVPDYRLARPEYIGGGSAVIHVTPVVQTAPTTTPVGTLGAAATGTVSARASYASTEHGMVLGLLSIRPEQAYQQGVPRKFSRATRYDYYWPSLAQLGEQAVLRQEIWATGVDADDATVFGYQERYAEYRQYYSEVAGRFRSGVTGTIDAWHLAQNFSAAPVLGDTFIRADGPVSGAFDRVLSAGATARTDVSQFLADILIQRDAVRPLPMFGTPVGMGRF